MWGNLSGEEKEDELYHGRMYCPQMVCSCLTADDVW